MADETTPELHLVKPEPGASRNSWGIKINDDLDKIDGVFDQDGNGTPVGLHIGPGHVLRINGSIVTPGGSGLPGGGLNDNSVPPGKLTFTSGNALAGRNADTAGKGMEIPCSDQSFDFLACTAKPAARDVIGAAGLADNIFTDDQTVKSVDPSAALGPIVTLARDSPSASDSDLLGRLSFAGRNAANSPLEYAAIQARLVDAGPVGEEDGALDLYSMLAGTSDMRFSVKGGLTARGLGDKGDGTVNATGVYVNGVSVSGSGDNVFTGDQTVISTDPTAALGPTIALTRDSSSAADNDLLGRLSFNGRNALDTAREYAAIQAKIADAANTTEDGSLDLYSMLGGTSNVRFSLRGGLSARGLADKGDGTVNATGFYVNGTLIDTSAPAVMPAGSVVGFDYAMTSGTTDSTANAIPNDNTTPQSGEGKQFLALNYNPKATGNKLKIEVVLCYEIAMDGSSNNTYATAALFLDSDTFAVAAASQGTTKNGNQGTIAFTYCMLAPSASAIAFKVRAGPATSAFTLATNGIFNGKQASSITITEIKA